MLGAQTMAELHKHLGDSVIASYGAPQDTPVYVPPTALVIVGTATLPAVGTPLSQHPSLGVGAIIPEGIEPPAFKKFLRQPSATLNGPQVVFVRFRPDVSSAARVADLKRVASAGNRALAALPTGLAGGDTVTLLGVQYPAEIENYRSIGLTPAVLALALAAGAMVALGFTLGTSVRRRRSDLAKLRALGLHRSSAPFGRGVAGLRERSRRGSGRPAYRHLVGTLALDTVRAPHRRRTRTDGARISGRHRNVGNHGAGERRGRPPRPKRGPHLHRSSAPRRIARGSLRFAKVNA